MAAKTLGRYELICEVAKGQLGPLWAAHATGSEGAPPVLIRRVSTAAPTTPDEIDTLSEGAWWMLEVQDTGIAHGVDVVKTEGELGVVTEYSEGEVLRSLLRLASFKRKPVSAAVGVRIGMDILEALDQALAQAAPMSNGQQGFCCGGLVPDSVLVGRDGHTRLLDIGVLGPASRVGPIARHPEMAAYSAPEVLASAESADIRANVYSVGVMLWEMFSGKRLFVGSTHQAVTEKVKAGGVQRLDSTKPVGGDVIPTSVADVVQKALDPDPAARYGSPKEMIDALSAAGEPADASAVSALVEDLAGNTLASRRKLVEKALHSKPAPVPKASVVVSQAARPAEAKSPADMPPPPKRKPTLLGLSPAAVEPTPRAKLESLDEEDLESVSKVELLSFPGSEPPTRPAATETKNLVARMGEPDGEGKGASGEAIKTQFLGTPAPDAAAAIAQAAAEAKAASPKPPEASPKPPEVSPKPPLTSPKPPEAKPLDLHAAGEIEEVPVSMDLEMISEPPPAKGDDDEVTRLKLPESATAKAAEAAVVGEKARGEPPPVVRTPSKPDVDKNEPKKEEKKDESAVAWVGPPPGVALGSRDSVSDAEAAEEEPVPSVLVERTQKFRKMVALGIGALVGLMALGIGISQLSKKDETPKEPATQASTEPAKTETPKVEEPKKEEPKVEAKKEETKAEETKAEETKAEETKAEETKAEETKAEETKAETPKPKPVVRTTPVYTAPKPRTVTKPTAKPKPKFTPSGI
jgi:eukaryotic-like serine/threonine-protein kinase